MSQPDELMRARDHLANERTFLAWVRTSLAVVVFGFAIGRYRNTRAQLESGRFEPVGSVIDLVAIFTVVFGLALAAYLVYTQQNLR